MRKNIYGNTVIIFIISFFITIVAFHFIYGLKIIIPTNISWLLDVRGDWGQHYLGWAFYRNDSWHFPLGQVENWYYPISTNIGFTDSIPLCAIFFKIWSPLLPTNFQYIGLWLFLCMFLLSFFSFKVLYIFKINIVISSIFVVFIVLNPVFLYRGMHPALCAQWLIIASIYLYFYKTNKQDVLKTNIYQGILLVLSGMIHPYLVAMIVGFNFILPFKNIFIEKTLQLKQGVIIVSISICLLFLIWFIVGLVGWKSIDLEVQNAYGLYGLNLNSLYNSVGISPILPKFEYVSWYQYEGFGYLGVGLLLICLISLGVLFYIIKKINIKKIIIIFPILFLSLFLTLFAITNVVTLDSLVLFRFPLPNFIKGIGEIFRASGRFFWLSYYLIIFFSLIIFARIKCSERIKIFFLLIILFIQVYDIKNFFNAKNLKLGNYHPPMTEERWNLLLSNFKNIITFPLYNTSLLNDKDYQDLGYLATKNKNSLTVAYVARGDTKLEKKISDSIVNLLNKGCISPDNLFITTDKELELFSFPLLKKGAKLLYIDGYYFIYSGSKQNFKIKMTDWEYKKMSIAYKKFLKMNYFNLFKKKDIKTTKNILSNFDELKINNKFIQTGGWAFLEDNKNSVINDSIFITLSNEYSVYYVNTKLSTRPDIKDCYKKTGNTGFQIVSYLDKVPKNKYILGIAIKDLNNNWYMKKTNTVIDLK